VLSGILSLHPVVTSMRTICQDASVDALERRCHYAMDAAVVDLLCCGAVSRHIVKLEGLAATCTAHLMSVPSVECILYNSCVVQQSPVSIK
jgi:hypothetical protein